MAAFWLSLGCPFGPAPISASARLGAQLAALIRTGFEDTGFGPNRGRRRSPEAAEARPTLESGPKHFAWDYNVLAPA